MGFFVTGDDVVNPCIKEVSTDAQAQTLLRHFVYKCCLFDQAAINVESVSHGVDASENVLSGYMYRVT
jgi:hypothetical protein